MTRESKSGLGPHVNWERKEKRRTARAFEECGRRRRHQTEGGPRTGGDDHDDDACLEKTLSDDPDCKEKIKELSHQIRSWTNNTVGRLLNIPSLYNLRQPRL